MLSTFQRKTFVFAYLCYQIVNLTNSGLANYNGVLTLIKKSSICLVPITSNLSMLLSISLNKDCICLSFKLVDKRDVN